MRTVLGIALAVLGTMFAITLGYELITGKPITGGVQGTMKRVGSETLDRVRTDPQGMFIHAKDENLPAFLAFLDLDTAVSDNAVAEYKELMDRIEQYFRGDTRKDIVKAVFVIRSANFCYPDLTHLQCLRYLNDCVPAGFDPKNPSDSPATHVVQMGDEISKMLVMKFYEPQIEAMKQQQAQQSAQAEYQARLNQTISDNAAKARAWGEAQNAARAAQSPRPVYTDQQVNWAWQNYRSRGY